MVIVLTVLGSEHLHHLSRYGFTAKGRELGRAFCARDDCPSSWLGNLESQRAWLLTVPTRKVSYLRRVLARLRSFFNRHDRFLGHAFFKHARFYSLRKKSARSGCWAGGRFTDDDDCLCGNGCHDHFCCRGYLSPHETCRVMGSDETRRSIPEPHRGSDFDVYCCCSNARSKHCC